MRRALGAAAVIGGIIYAVSGAHMAAGNLRWFGRSPGANEHFLWLGIGFVLIVVAFGAVRGRQIWRQGPPGQIASVAGVVAPLMLLVSRMIEFAILGTLMTFIAILAFAVTVHLRKLMPRVDVVLLYVAALASITWNTETGSAALLVIVGLVASWISYRALVASAWRSAGSKPIPV